MTFLPSSFPWADMKRLIKMESLALADTGIASIPADVPWTYKVRLLDFSSNAQLRSVGSNAFKAATGLRELILRYSNPDMAFAENAFFLVNTGRPDLVLRAAGGKSNFRWEENAFGNEDGSQMWGRLVVSMADLPEEVFRGLIRLAVEMELDGT